MTPPLWKAAGVAAMLAGLAGCGAGWKAREARDAREARAREALAGAGESTRAEAGAGAADAVAENAGASGLGVGRGGALPDSELEDAETGESEAAPTTGVPAATRYAGLDRGTCEVELARRKIAFERVEEARGVVAPLRLKGAIAGVEFHSMLPIAQRRTSPYEIYDCRLVLALDDWARVLARHDVVEVVHYSVYRPPSPKAVRTRPGRRHGGALAIDAAIFKRRDGSTMSVEKDFHGRIGGKPCGANAASLPAEAVTLRQIVCEAADAQLFNVMLTPDYNWPHRNHFHLEVTAGVRWVLVR